MAKFIENVDELKDGRLYRDKLKLQLKRCKDEDTLFISKNKVEFETDGRSWEGYAVLVGDIGERCAKKLKRFGVKFLEGVCKKQGRNLEISELDSRYARGAKQTFSTVGLPYRVKERRSA